MLNRFIINSLDTVNIIYLWVVLTKKNNNIFKLFSSILITSILITIIEQLGLNFIVAYIIDIIIIKIVYKKRFKRCYIRIFFNITYRYEFSINDFFNY